MITKEQIKTILKNCNYNQDIKEEWVQWVTNDSSKTSLKELSQEQAEQIIKQQTGTSSNQQPATKFEYFDKENKKHKVVLSLLYQLGWTTTNPQGKEIPNMSQLATWLQSKRSPVQKPLTQQSYWETEKIIKALSQMIVKKPSTINQQPTTNNQ